MSEQDDRVIQMSLDEALAWIKKGIENGNYQAARDLLEDVIRAAQKNAEGKSS